MKRLLILFSFLLHLTIGFGQQMMGGIVSNFTPSQVLDYTKGVLPGGTLTRSSIGTRFNAQGNLETVAANEPRFDYDPLTLQPRGLLLEESRINVIPNNTMTGAAIGTPPTGWFGAGSGGGITCSIVGTGTENGMKYIDLNWSGTSTASSVYGYFFVSPTSVAASSGQSWTGSLYWKLIAGDASSIQFSVYGRTAANASSEARHLLVAPTSTITRLVNTLTLTSANTAYATAAILLNYTAGQSYNVTVRIYAPQLEQGTYATTVIPSTNGAVTRAQDFYTMPITGWYNPTEGAMLVEFSRIGIPPSLPTSDVFVGLSGQGANIFLESGAGSPTQQRIRMAWDGVTTVNTAFSNGQPGIVYKLAASWKTDDVILAQNGVLSAIDNTATIPMGINTLVAQRTGYLRRIIYYPRRLPNSFLQSLTQ